jgi:hypothetical protein
MRPSAAPSWVARHWHTRPVVYGLRSAVYCSNGRTASASASVWRVLAARLVDVDRLLSALMAMVVVVLLLLLPLPHTLTLTLQYVHAHIQ